MTMQPVAFASLEQSGVMAGSLAPTVTLHDVELCTTGTHVGSAGATPVHRQHFESMLAAAGDPEIDAAAMHPGHFDPRFVQTTFDGEPAIGYARATRIVDLPDGRSKLIGDLVDVPAKLAAIIPKAYARRSIEFEPRITPSGRAYPATLTGLGLLGVAIPAVKGLADVMNRYSAQPIAAPGPQIHIDDTPTGVQSLAAAWFTAGDDVARAALVPLEGVAMTHLDQARYAQLVQAESVRHAQAMAQMLSAATVTEQAAPALPGYPGMPAPTLTPPAAPAAAGPAAMPQWFAAPTAPAAPVQPFAAPPVAQPFLQPPAAAAPAQLPAGYALDASGQLVPVVAQPQFAAPAAPPAFFQPPAQPAAPLQPLAYGQPAPVQMPQFAGQPAAAQPFAGQPYAGQPVTPQLPPAMPQAPVDPSAGMPAVAALSAGQLSELQARADRGDAAMQALEAQQRGHYLDTAVSQGRIALSERPAWELSLSRDLPGTVNLLNTLTPGRVPVDPAGQAVALSGAPSAGGVSDAAWDAWESETFGTAPAAAPAQPQMFAGYAQPAAQPMFAVPMGA